MWIGIAGLWFHALFSTIRIMIYFMLKLVGLWFHASFFNKSFCRVNLLQRSPLQFDEEQGLWILRRELPVSVFHDRPYICSYKNLQVLCMLAHSWVKVLVLASGVQPTIYMFLTQDARAMEMILLWYWKLCSRYAPRIILGCTSWTSSQDVVFCRHIC